MRDLFPVSRCSDASAWTALVVDDHRFMRAILWTMLAALGARRVFEASNAAAALEILAEEHVDVVVLDYRMTPVDGVSLARVVRSLNERFRTVPIVMVSGHASRSLVQRARDAGVDEFVSKPLTVRALAKRLDSVMTRPRSFVECAGFAGPDRRRRTGVPGESRRRAADRSEAISL